jgi:hypothetical protein
MALLTRESRLTRSRCALALTEEGFPIKAATLATLASRGGGPEYEVFGKSTIYTWGKALDWARSRSKPRASTSEADLHP